MREDSSDSRKTLLVLGGSSSIAKPIIETAILEGYHVYASFRDFKKTWKDENLTWVYLDTGKIESLDDFLNEINLKTTDRVMCLIGTLSGIELTNIDVNKFESYLVEQLINLSVLIIRIFESLEPSSRMLIMSSRAAKRSYDFSYAIVKSGVESLVLSLRNRNKFNNINYVRSGLILNSSMYFDMTGGDHLRHITQSNGTLLSLGSAATEIWQIFDKSWADNEGFFLGREY